MQPTHYLCVHCHFYQPTRGNPLSNEPLIEPGAAPYPNWNARITAECYQPNAELGNIDLISFNMGETLASWLETNSPETYHLYIEADRRNVEKTGSGNAVAQPMHHTILPLDRRADKITQVSWGQTVFRHRYGRNAEGMWLPEMAVDLETLEVLVDQGIQWTILTESQLKEIPPGAGPFVIRLPGGKSMKVFLRDETLSNDIAFNLGNFGGAGRWSRDTLIPRTRTASPLTLIATDGETFGHHWKDEEHFLHWLLTYEAQSAGYEIVTLNRYAQLVDPVAEVEILEDTAWSSGFALGRWSTGSPDTEGAAYWKGGIRRAFDNLKWQADAIFNKEVARLKAGNPLTLRDGFIKVVLGYLAEKDYLRDREVESPRKEENIRLLSLIKAQYFRQQMYSSCSFFFDRLNDLSSIYGIASAYQVIKLTRDATGIDLEPDFLSDLRHATDHTREGESITGQTIYEQIAREAS